MLQDHKSCEVIHQESVRWPTCAVGAAALVDRKEGGLGRQHGKQVHQLNDEVRQNILVVVHVRRYQIPLCAQTTTSKRTISFLYYFLPHNMVLLCPLSFSAIVSSVASMHLCH